MINHRSYADAVAKLRPQWDLNLWPLQYLSSALPTELLRHLGADNISCEFVIYDENSYHPNSVLPLISKLMKRAIQVQLLSFLDDNREHGSCFACFFLVLLVTSIKLLLGQTFSHAIFDVYMPKTAEILPPWILSYPWNQFLGCHDAKKAL